MSENNIFDFGNAASVIKDAILQSRYQAAKLINKELLSLYYGVGKYVSDNSRCGYWGQGAIRQISETLQRELPGLRGFSEVSIKRMRLFYEAWSFVFSNRPLLMDNLKKNTTRANRPLPTDDLKIIMKLEDFIDLELLKLQLNAFASPLVTADQFLPVGFTHHSEILAKEKTIDGRLFYISQCAAEFWSVEALKSSLRGELYTRTSKMPNNFLRTLPFPEQARRAIRSFKDEYLLDFINIEDENDPEVSVIFCVTSPCQENSKARTVAGAADHIPSYPLATTRPARKT